jgi:hypothetical protein
MARVRSQVVASNDRVGRDVAARETVVLPPGQRRRCRQSNGLRDGPGPHPTGYAGPRTPRVLAGAMASYEGVRRVAARATVVANSSTPLASPVVMMGGMEAGS